MQYECKRNETLDLICWNHYGSERYTVMVLEANSHLATVDVHLPAGLVIELPAITPSPTPVTESVQLWS